MKYFIIISLLLTSTTSYADCDKNVEFLKNKTTHTTKCDGFFVKQELMENLKKTDEKSKILEREKVLLKDLSVRKDEMIDYYKNRLKETDSDLSKEKTKGFMRGAGGFILGVLATSIAAYAAIQSTNK